MVTMTAARDNVRITAQSQARCRRKTRKVVMIGSSKSGKTMLIKRYLDNSYSEEYTPTVEDCYNRDIKYKGFDLNVEFIDMCGPTMFPAMLALNVKSADLVILTYEIDNETSVKEAGLTFEKIQDIKTNTKVILVGTMLDLFPSYKDACDYELSPLYCKYLQHIDAKHILTSSKTSEHVQDCFELAFDIMIVRINAMSLSARTEDKRQKKCCTLL